MFETPRDLILGIDAILFFAGLILFMLGLLPKKGETNDGPQTFARNSND